MFTKKMAIGLWMCLLGIFLWPLVLDTDAVMIYLCIGVFAVGSFLFLSEVKNKKNEK